MQPKCSAISSVSTGVPKARVATSGRRRRAVGAVLLAAVLIAAIALAAVGVLAEHVNGTSMMPTLRHGDRFLTALGSAGRVRRFDVVVLDEPGTAVTIVKRVIAVPGDKFEIRSSAAEPMQVLIQPGGTGSWFRVVSPALQSAVRRDTGCCDQSGRHGEANGVQTVPAGKFFFLGDNPDESRDSRTFGWGDIAGVQGRVGVRVWPWSASHAIGNRPTLVLQAR